MRENRQAKTANLIAMLNPLIRGWANYHRHAVAKRIFQKADSLTFKQLWYWANDGIQGNLKHLFKAGLVPVTRHIKIKAEANPFDPEGDDYFGVRYTQKWFSSK